MTHEEFLKAKQQLDAVLDPSACVIAEAERIINAEGVRTAWQEGDPIADILAFRNRIERGDLSW